MVFVRVKKVNGKEYGYLVKNRRNKRQKKVKQKVVGYLGRLYRLEKERELEFPESIDLDFETYLKRVTKERILKDLVKFELMKHGFVSAGSGSSVPSGIWKKDDIVVDIEKKKIRNDSKSKVVLAINEGHLCEYKIRKLFNYKQTGDLEETGLDLARMFVDSGLDIPQEMFIVFYEKL